MGTSPFVSVNPSTTEISAVPVIAADRTIVDQLSPERIAALEAGSGMSVTNDTEYNDAVTAAMAKYAGDLESAPLEVSPALEVDLTEAEELEAELKSDEEKKTLFENLKGGCDDLPFGPICEACVALQSGAWLDSLGELINAGKNKLSFLTQWQSALDGGYADVIEQLFICALNLSGGALLTSGVKALAFADKGQVEMVSALNKVVSGRGGLIPQEQLFRKAVANMDMTADNMDTIVSAASDSGFDVSTLVMDTPKGTDTAVHNLSKVGDITSRGVGGLGPLVSSTSERNQLNALAGMLQ